MEWYEITLLILAIVLIIVLIIRIFLHMPGSKKNIWEYKWLLDTPIAHRGYHTGNSEVPENSKKAYLRAIKKKYNIEIDLNLTKDGRVVVFHDENVKRMTGVDKEIINMTLDEIKELRLLQSDEQIMTLEEFLELVNSQVGILIEFKSSFKGKLEEASYKILKEYKGKWVMQAFQPGSLKWFKLNAPEVPRGQLCLNYMKEPNVKFTTRFLFTNLYSNFIGRPHFISYQHTGISNHNVKLLHNLYKVDLLVWTIQNDAQYQEVKDKVSNVIFENLDL